MKNVEVVKMTRVLWVVKNDASFVGVEVEKNVEVGKNVEVVKNAASFVGAYVLLKKIHHPPWVHRKFFPWVASLKKFF